MLKLEEITHYYKKQKRPALSSVSLDLPEAGFVLIKGKSGSGKTTLINLLSCLDSPTSGSIFFNDELLKGKKAEEYKKHDVAIVFQDYNLIRNLTIGDNMRIAYEAAGLEYDKEDVLSLLRFVNLEDYEDILNRYPSEISGGQLQRIAIARALAKRPRIIILDEPTSALDYDNANDILDKLKTMSREILVIVASHDLLRLEKYADYTISLNHGKADFAVINQVQKTSNEMKECVPLKSRNGFSMLSRLKYVLSLRKKNIFRLVSSCFVSVFSLIVSMVSFSLTFGDIERATMSGVTSSSPFFLTSAVTDDGYKTTKPLPEEVEAKLEERGYYRFSNFEKWDFNGISPSSEPAGYYYGEREVMEWAIEIREETVIEDFLLKPDKRFSKSNEFRLPTKVDEVAISSSLADYLFKYREGPENDLFGQEPYYTSLNEIYTKGYSRGLKIVGIFQTPECEGDEFLESDDVLSEAKRHGFSMRSARFVCPHYSELRTADEYYGEEYGAKYGRTPYMLGKVMESKSNELSFIKSVRFTENGRSYHLGLETQYSYLSGTLDSLKISSFSGKFVFGVAIISVIISIFSNSSLFYYLAKKDEISLGILKSIGANKREISALVATGALVLGLLCFASLFALHVTVCFLGDFILTRSVLVMFPVFSFPLLLATGCLVISSIIAGLCGACKAVRARSIQVIKEL